MKKIWYSMISLSIILVFSAFSNSYNNISKLDCSEVNDILIDANLNLDDSSLRGSLINNSIENDYDEVRIKIDYFDMMGLLVSSETLMVAEDLDPGENEKFKFRLKEPDEAVSAQWAVVCADE